MNGCYLQSGRLKVPDSHPILLVFIWVTWISRYLWRCHDSLQTGFGSDFGQRLADASSNSPFMSSISLSPSLLHFFLSLSNKKRRCTWDLEERGNPSDHSMAPCPSCINSAHFKGEGKWGPSKGHPAHFLQTQDPTQPTARTLALLFNYQS